MSDTRKQAEATARYLLSVADETTLGTFEEELVECIRALLAEQDGAGAGPRCQFCGSRQIERDPREDMWECRTCIRAWKEGPAPSPAGDEVREALLHCESIFLRYEVNRPDTEQVTDGALALIRKALSAISSGSTRRETSGCVCSDKARGYCPVHDTFLPTPPPPPAPEAAAVREAALTRDDAMTLIGHAEYLRRVHGEQDMPRFFDGLARRLLAALAARGERGE